MALSNDPADPKFRLAVKIVHKYFTPSKGKEPSFHRAVAHTLHLQNEVAAMAKLSAENTFLLPLYCAFQDDLYVYIVCERGCCTLKQLIQHSHEDELQQLLAFQQAQPLKFISFCMLMSLSMMHACWSMQNGRLIHHDIHPAQILVTADGRPRLSDLGQCSVISADNRKQLLPPLGRRDFCRPAKLGPLQGSEVDGYGCGATLWVTWKGSYDQIKKVEREWNKHEERELLQEKLEQLATKAIQAPPPRWAFAALVRRPAPLAACAQMPPSYPRPRRVRAMLTPCCRLACAQVQKHIKKCFEGAKQMQLIEPFVKGNRTHECEGLIASDGETVAFNKNVVADGPVEQWMVQLEEMMILSMQKITTGCLQGFRGKKGKWVHQWPGQLLITAGMIVWTSDCTRALGQVATTSSSPS